MNPAKIDGPEANTRRASSRDFTRLASGETALDAAIRTEHLTKVYGNRVVAVNDMGFEVPQGAVFGLLGPNGAGKTTTLRLLLGLQLPTAGWAEIFGRRCGPAAVDVRRSIGYLPTNPKLPGYLRPLEYLDLVGQLCRVADDVRKPRIASLLRAVGLLGNAGQRIGTLSTGETTRLGIAASLVGDPPLLIWDEPTAGLDPAARRFTLDLIRDLARSRTVVIATHILGDIDQICDHVGVMHEGRMIFCGPMRDMKCRLRRDDFVVELDGPSESLGRLAQEASALPGVSARCQDERGLVVRVAEEHNRTEAMAEVLRRAAACGLALLSVHSGLNETEHAYLQLLQEDEAHGFQRFDLPAHRRDDAPAGNLPV
jgi:ABC-2 type transport system ATP-binding protein